MFDAFGVEEHEATFAHVEGDAGPWVVEDLLPGSLVRAGNILDDHHRVVGRGGRRCLVFLGAVDDEGIRLPQSDAVELALGVGAESQVFVSVIVEGLEQDVADQFVVAGRLYAEAVAMPPTVQGGVLVV